MKPAQPQWHCRSQTVRRTLWLFLKQTEQKLANGRPACLTLCLDGVPICVRFEIEGLGLPITRGGGVGEDKADRRRGGETTSGNGQAWSSPSPRGQWRTDKNGGKWLWNHLWCPNDPRGFGIDDDDVWISNKWKVYIIHKCREFSHSQRHWQTHRHRHIHTHTEYVNINLRTYCIGKELNVRNYWILKMW